MRARSSGLFLMFSLLSGYGNLGAQQPTDSVIYGALFVHFYRGRLPDSVPVLDSTFALVSGATRFTRDVIGRLRTLSVPAAGLLEQLDSLVRRPEPSRALVLPAQVKIVTRVPHPDYGDEHVLPGPGRPGIFTLSRVAYSADGQQAIVLFHWDTCGARCSEESAAFFTHQPGVGWRFTRMFPLWSS